MAGALVCVAVVHGIYPADRTVWCVEIVWAVGLWAVLLLTRRKFRASAIAVYAVSSGRVFDSASILGSSASDSSSPSWQSR